MGFVRALESKSRLSESQVPHVTNLSRKGGSPVAAAVVNAILMMAEARRHAPARSSS